MLIDSEAQGSMYLYCDLKIKNEPSSGAVERKKNEKQQRSVPPLYPLTCPSTQHTKLDDQKMKWLEFLMRGRLAEIRRKDQNVL